MSKIRPKSRGGAARDAAGHRCPKDGPCQRAEEPSSRKPHDLDGYANKRPGNGPFLTRKTIQATVAGSRCNCYESLTYLSKSPCDAHILNCCHSPSWRDVFSLYYGRFGSLRFPGGGKICGTEALLHPMVKRAHV